MRLLGRIMVAPLRVTAIPPALRLVDAGSFEQRTKPEPSLLRTDDDMPAAENCQDQLRFRDRIGLRPYVVEWDYGDSAFYSEPSFFDDYLKLFNIVCTVAVIPRWQALI